LTDFHTTPFLGKEGTENYVDDDDDDDERTDNP